jgi:predicted amidohydrolase YtcJ
MNRLLAYLIGLSILSLSSIAIDAYTINAAKALGLTQVTGSIEVGKSADIVILDRNILDKEANEIANAQVTHTILQGDIVYRQ